MEFTDFVRKIPPFTKFYMASTLAVSVIITFNVINPYLFLLDFEKVAYSLHLWRPFTNFMVGGKLSFSTIFLMFIIHYAYGNLEKDYSGRKHDYYWILFCCALLHFFVGWLLGSYSVLLQPMLGSVLYIFCKKNPDEWVNVWGFIFRSANLPWVHLIMSVLMGGDFFSMLTGIAVGHLWIFLDDTLPETHNIVVTSTPKWFAWLVNWIAIKVDNL